MYARVDVLFQFLEVVGCRGFDEFAVNGAFDYRCALQGQGPCGI